MKRESPEITYYRAVEDLFSSLRGAPHILSPRDFQLLRSWWRDEVPFSAVTAGLTEVFARQQEREDSDPVVSLSYCRHAVKRHAKRIAEMNIGQAGDTPRPDESGVNQGLRRLTEALAEAADRLAESGSPVADVLTRIGRQIEIVGRELPPDTLDQHLFELESTMLKECWQALPEEDRREIDKSVEAAVSATSTSDEARRRSGRALRDREIRLQLGLPRLEIGG